tara:strand:+ start:7566 stop:7871 length:306 start_codon:yes stop_codon:yes gene_type:complete
MSEDFRLYEAQRIRYLLLLELSHQPSGSWTLSMLTKAMRARGYQKLPDFLLNQLQWLESECLAVRLVPANDETVVKLRGAGRHHVDGTLLLHGVDRPDDEA